MITPSFALTATERVLPRMALDFTTAILDPRVTFTRTGNTATVVNSSGYISNINADLPRFDYDPVTLVCKGLLIEESRENRLLQSNNFTTTWTNSNSTEQAAAAVSPDGTTNATKLITNATSNNGYLIQSTTFTLGQNYTYSFFAKKGETTNVFMFISDGVTGRSAEFNLNTGVVVGTPTVGLSASIVPFANGWYRCVGTINSGGTVGSVRITQNIINANGTDGLFCYGAQIETGAFATSYIPTVASQVTRTADVATMTGTNFSDWYNASEGSFEVTASNFATDSTQRRAVNANDTTNQNIIDISRIGSTAQSRSTVTTLGATVFNSLNAAWPVSTTSSVVTSYKQDDFAACLGGGTLRTDNLGGVPAATQLQIGNLLSIQFWCGHIQKVMYWPQRLTNNEVQAFSK